MAEIILENVLIFVVLLNPISKIILLASIEEEITPPMLIRISRQATLTAVCILVAFAFLGLFMLNTMFRIELTSLQVVGGIVLFMVGLRAIQKGEFFSLEYRSHIEEIAAVPIAAPLIAGPAAIAAAIAQSAQFNPAVVSLAIIIASFINMVLMMYSFKISRLLKKFHLINPLIRITGLLISSVGMNMALTGVRSFFAGFNI